MYEMNEVRIKPRNLGIFLGGLVFVLFVLLRSSSNNCSTNGDGPHKAATLNRGVVDQHVPTIYAITPTYARPVQKAELTRFVQ